ncbi:response regulator [candidate division KSB1 bacterium]
MKLALIIDDDKVARDAITDLLKRVSFKIETASDGMQGATMIKTNNYDMIIHDKGQEKKIKKNHYDLILLDLKMKGLDGEQVLTVVNRFNNSLPVLVVSGYLTKDKFINLKKMGVKGFITKPIDINKFYQAVNQICPINTGNN